MKPASIILAIVLSPLQSLLKIIGGDSAGGAFVVAPNKPKPPTLAARAEAGKKGKL